MRRRIAYPLAAVAALGSIAALACSTLQSWEVLLLWNSCPVRERGQAFALLLQACLLAVSALVAVISVSRLTPRWIAIVLGLALVVVMAQPLFFGYLLASSSPYPEEMKEWLACGLTEGVANARALALLLPTVGVGGVGIALVVSSRRLSDVVLALIALVVVGGWTALLIAVALS